VPAGVNIGVADKKSCVIAARSKGHHRRQAGGTPCLARSKKKFVCRKWEKEIPFPPIAKAACQFHQS
jgi:hypothetical protein